MATSIDKKLKVTRDQLAAFIKDPNTIKQFENLFAYINNLSILTTGDLPDISDLDPSFIGDIRHTAYQNDNLLDIGYLPFALDNAVSTEAEYENLWNEIGHKYNDLHVWAGDTDLSASTTLFYPTPPPTEDGWLTVWEGEETESTPIDNIWGIGLYRLTIGLGTGTTTEYGIPINVYALSTVTQTLLHVATSGAADRIYGNYSPSGFAANGVGIYNDVAVLWRIEKWVPETLSKDGVYAYIKAEAV